MEGSVEGSVMWWELSSLLIKVSARPNRWTARVTSCSAVAGSAMSPAIVSTPGSCEVLMVREFATTAYSVCGRPRRALRQSLGKHP